MAYKPRPVRYSIPLPPPDLSFPPPAYRLPALISTYSHLPDRSIRHDDTSMSYYSPAPVGADLTWGFENRIERDDTIEEHLDGLCEALRRVQEDGGQAERPGGVITWRGMITRIMTAPYEDREGWEMTLTPLAGSIYMELHDPPEAKAKRGAQQSSWALQTYMGYAYESYSTIPSSGAERGDENPEGWSGNVNTNVQWCNVVRSAIGDIPVCLGGEVDCVQAEPGTSHPGLEKCVELKTNKVIRNRGQEAVFHKKLLKHWAQSWLLGVSTVEVGFRDDEGIIKSQRTFETTSIPRFVASTPRPAWHPSTCVHFLHAVLQLTLTHVLPTDPAPSHRLGEDDELPQAAVWRLAFSPGRGCELYQVHDEPASEGRWGGMLTEDYVRWKMSR